MERVSGRSAPFMVSMSSLLRVARELRASRAIASDRERDRNNRRVYFYLTLCHFPLQKPNNDIQSTSTLAAKMTYNNHTLGTHLSIPSPYTYLGSGSFILASHS